MTHEESTLQTKKALAVSLKKHMEKKPLKKITVNDIITDCNVNRKTFYYHFCDIYDLLKWILEQEAVEVVKQFDLLTDCREVLVFVVDYVEANAHILNCAYDSIGRDEMKRFLCSDFYEVIHNYIDDVEKEKHLNSPEEYKSFLCELTTEALAGMLINLFKNKQGYDKERMIHYLSLTLQSSLPIILANASQNGVGDRQLARLVDADER